MSHYRRTLLQQRKLDYGIQHNVFTCANSNVLIITWKYTRYQKQKQKKKKENYAGWLEGTGDVSVGMEQSHELLFSPHLPHQLDAHDQ